MVAVPYALIPYFLAVAEQGSLTLAADICAISQPALSRKIRQIETVFSARLFERRARGMVLTPEGEVLLARARMMRIEIQRAQDEIRLLQGAASGQISVLAGPVWCQELLPPLLRQVVDAFPGLSVDLRLAPPVPRLEEVVAGEVDLYAGGLDVTECRRLGMTAVQALALRYMVFAPRAHPLRTNRDTDPAEIVRHAWTVYSGDGAWPLVSDMLYREHGAIPQVTARCDTLASGFALAETIGTLVGATDRLAPFAARFGLAPLPGASFVFEFPSGYCYAPAAAKFPPVARLIELLATVQDAAAS